MATEPAAEINQQPIVVPPEPISNDVGGGPPPINNDETNNMEQQVLDGGVDLNASLDSLDAGGSLTDSPTKNKRNKKNKKKNRPLHFLRLKSF